MNASQRQPDPAVRGLQSNWEAETHEQEAIKDGFSTWLGGTSSRVKGAQNMERLIRIRKTRERFSFFFFQRKVFTWKQAWSEKLLKGCSDVSIFILLGMMWPWEGHSDSESSQRITSVMNSWYPRRGQGRRDCSQIILPEAHGYQIKCPAQDHVTY